MDKKDRRNPNFSTTEMMKLTEEVDHRKDMLFSKYNDLLTNAMKKRAWEVISSEVNAVNHSGYKRTGPNMRKKWTCLASETKKKLASIKNGSIQDIITPLESKILQIIGETSAPEVTEVLITPKEEIEDITEEEESSSFPSVSETLYNENNDRTSPSPSDYCQVELNGKRKFCSVNTLEEQTKAVFEKERLDIENRRLKIDQKLLKLEEERLELKKQKLEVEKDRYRLMENYLYQSQLSN